MSGKTGKKDLLIRVVLTICFLITVLSYFLGNMMYRTNIRNTYQNLIYVELTDFVENIRYGLHFGKSMESFYGMNELLRKEVEGSDRLEGLYVLSAENEILFATDDETLSQEVSELTDGNVVSERKLYAAMYLTQDKDTRLIARCNADSIYREQKSYAMQLLLQSVIGFLVTDGIMLLLWYFFREKAYLMRLLVPVLILWIALDSAAVGASAYQKYAESIGEMNRLIEESVLEDLHAVEETGVARNQLSSVDSYLKRYEEGIHEIKDVRMDENEVLVIISKPYIRRVFLDYTLQTILFLTFSALILAEYQIFVNYTSGEETDEPDTI